MPYRCNVVIQQVPDWVSEEVLRGFFEPEMKPVEFSLDREQHSATVVLEGVFTDAQHAADAFYQPWKSVKAPHGTYNLSYAGDHQDVRGEDSFRFVLQVTPAGIVLPYTMWPAWLAAAVNFIIFCGLCIALGLSAKNSPLATWVYPVIEIAVASYALGWVISASAWSQSKRFGCTVAAVGLLLLLRFAAISPGSAASPLAPADSTPSTPIGAVAAPEKTERTSPISDYTYVPKELRAKTATIPPPSSPWSKPAVKLPLSDTPKVLLDTPRLQSNAAPAIELVPRDDSEGGLVEFGNQVASIWVGFGRIRWRGQSWRASVEWRSTLDSSAISAGGGRPSTPPTQPVGIGPGRKSGARD